MMSDFSLLLITLVFNNVYIVLIYSRGVREGLFLFPFPPIPMKPFPFPFPPIPMIKTYSRSHFSRYHYSRFPFPLPS